jgi:hypothetical protein
MKAQILTILVLAIVLAVLFTQPATVDAKRKKRKTSFDKDTDNIKYSSQEELRAKVDDLNKEKKMKMEDSKMTKEEFEVHRRKLEKEEKELQTKVDVATKAYGRNSSQRAKAMHELGRNIYMQGRFEEVLQSAEEIVRIHEVIDGVEHLNTGMALQNVGNVAYRMNKQTKCYYAMQRALYILLREYQDGSREVMLHRGKMMTFKIDSGKDGPGLSYDEYMDDLADYGDEAVPDL